MKLPIYIRDVSPHPNATRITGMNQSGLPSGVHTGGTWKLNGEIWKPLDGRPFANADYHLPTKELECLEKFAGMPLFPQNWRKETVNGRNFIVRQKGYLIPEDRPLDKYEALQVEQAIRDMNANGWELNDDVALAQDPTTYELYLYDLSVAWEVGNSTYFKADDEWRIHKFFENNGFSWIKKLRIHARHITNNIEFFMNERKEGYKHIYASFSRPIDAMWATIHDAEYQHETRANWSEAVPWTWVITKELLPEETLKRYELTWGWSPINYKEL